MSRPTDSFRYQCSKCDEWHFGVPALAAEAPAYYYDVPENERGARCELTTDTCIVDEQLYFVRGNIDVAVEGLDEPFQWGVWASVSSDSFKDMLLRFEDTDRVDYGPYFGWLSAHLEIYPETENLKTNVHVQEVGIRPKIELEPTDHPLAIEQRNGISQRRLAEILSHYIHQ